VWVPYAPDVGENLRQGDLLVGVAFPRAGTVELSVDGLRGDVDEDVSAVVLEHCCNIQQRHVLTLARVKSQSAKGAMMAALQNVEPTVGKPYSRYMHLLDAHPALPTKSGKVKVINLLDRVYLLDGGDDAFLAHRQRRVARMNVVARAHLRLKLTVHFGRAEEEQDLPALEALGLDEFGLPAPRPVQFGFPE
jgi:hypothetical protein